MKRKAAPLIIALAAFLFVVAAGVGAYVVLSSTAKPVAVNNAGSASAASNYTILHPATVPPKISECSQTLTYASNGNPSPVTCNDGGLNVLAWNAISAQEPKVMTLGYGATQAQVQSAMCADASAANLDSSVSISEPLEITAYRLSALYYGWNFQVNPQTLLSSC